MHLRVHIQGYAMHCIWEYICRNMQYNASESRCAGVCEVCVCDFACDWGSCSI